MKGSNGSSTPVASQPLYFFPDKSVTETELRQILSNGTPGERAWAISHLVRYAVWDDIWHWTTRDEVRALLPQLELSDTLRAALARMLKVDATVG